MKKNKPQKKPLKLTGNELKGLLITHYGQSVDVESSDGRIIRCHLRKNNEPVITGDEVLFLLDENQQNGIIADFLPRKSLFFRPDGKSKQKPLAANIDLLIIVVAPNAFYEHLLDRFLVAAEYLKISPLILFNKSDLLSEKEHQEILERLQIYRNLGYETLFSSTVINEGLHAFKSFLKNKKAVLVGASGVGKSSITSALTYDDFVKVGETSSTGHGKHTTTFTRLYHLPDGGSIIDSPGVREFGLGELEPDAILQGFIEFKPYLSQCKYRNCRHGTDTGCALQQALHEGKISSKRYLSYQSLIEKTNKTSPF